MLTGLETERLRLRPFTPDDLDLLVELHTDPAVMTYLTGGKPTPLAKIRDEQLPRFSVANPSTGAHTGYAAELLTTGEFVGWFLLEPEPAGVELGYRLHARHWGHGYATEGSRALMSWAFTSSPITRIFAETMAVNSGSRRVMEKSGLRYVRTFFQEWPGPIDGSELGEVEYALTRDEWLTVNG